MISVVMRCASCEMLGGMTTTDRDQTRWTRRASDAVIESVAAGVDPAEIRALVERAITEGQRVAAIRRGEMPADRPAPARTGTIAPPGSAAERLLR